MRRMHSGICLKQCENMKIIDLTQKITKDFRTDIVNIVLSGSKYHAFVHQFHLSSMAGTYIDFPGHIKEFDNGFDSSNYPVEKLFMVDATVIKLNRSGKQREIHSEELEAAGVALDTPAVIVDAGWNALKEKNQDEIYFFEKDAITWFISKNIYLFVSDVYENHKDPRGIFVEFFRKGILTICNPANLEKITASKVKLCIFPLRIPGATQVPCRIIAVM